jgi:hypothetical protein
VLLGPIGTIVGRLLHSPYLAVGMTTSVANGWLWLMMVVGKSSKAGRCDVFARPIRSTHRDCSSNSTSPNLHSLILLYTLLKSCTFCKVFQLSVHKLDNKNYLPQGHTDYDLEETDTHTFSRNRLRVLLNTLKRDLSRLRDSTSYDIAR